VKPRGQYRRGRRFARLTPPLMRSPVGRSLLLRDTMARPRQIPADAAAAMAAEYAATPDFEAHLEATSAERFREAPAIGRPATIVWGEKERLVPKEAGVP